jgi:hypothetical protein
MPRLLNYIVAIYLIVMGLLGLFGTGSLSYFAFHVLLGMLPSELPNSPFLRRRADSPPEVVIHLFGHRIVIRCRYKEPHGHLLSALKFAGGGTARKLAATASAARSRS